MKNLFRRATSLLLTAALLCGVGVDAAASAALGDELMEKDVQIHEETQLSTNVFWSATYTDRRTEHLITYRPNASVTPIITHGGSLTSRSTVSAMAKDLEARGYRVVAGLNGDFYNFGNGLPIGIVVTEGQLRSTDAGFYGIGFRPDGTAVLSKPGVKVSADLGYSVNSGGKPVQITRSVAAVNKARVSEGGLYLYTYDFNSRHTTGNTEPGVDVLCTITGGDLSIGGQLTAVVDQVAEASSATAMGPGQIVLSANLKSSEYYLNALRQMPLGATVTLDITAADPEWNDVEYGIGALYSLVENGAVSPGLEKGMNPRTAVGQKADGTLVFYTIDGRKPGHSIGATLTQVAQRLIELGCVRALCLDGGGSTTLTVTEPDAVKAQTVNRPSEGSERAVSNQIFLVAGNTPSGVLDHFYVTPEADYVLGGSQVKLSATGVDTNYLPMERSCEFRASSGTVNGDVLTTPKTAGAITVTAESGGRTGKAVIHVLTEPDAVGVRDSSGELVSRLTVSPGTVHSLRASAAYRHIPLKADPTAFQWTVTGGIGTITPQGVFTAGAPGSGQITVSVGSRKVEIPVTVSRAALRTVEDFESGSMGRFLGTGSGVTFTAALGEEARFGRSAGELNYTLTGESPAEWTLTTPLTVSGAYTGLNLWVRGDGSGNQLQLLGREGQQEETVLLTVPLDFTGWKQVNLQPWSETRALTGLRISAGAAAVRSQGTVGLDQLVATFGSLQDTEVPSVKVRAEGGQITAVLSDGMDGLLPISAMRATVDGREQTFSCQNGTMTFTVPEDGAAHRVTVTAKDASGNIGRDSVTIPAAEGTPHQFTDLEGYWAADYVDFLYTANITTGYQDGTFRPNQNITRAQFSVMLYRYLGLDETLYEDMELPFADLSGIPEYARPAIRALYSEGIINGTWSGGKLYFHPNNSLTRAQAATMIGRTQEKGYASQNLTFTDGNQIPNYAIGYIQTMAAQGIISGYEDGSFKPQANITRGQMAKILYQLL